MSTSVGVTHNYFSICGDEGGSGSLQGFITKEGMSVTRASLSLSQNQRRKSLRSGDMDGFKKISGTAKPELSTIHPRHCLDQLAVNLICL